MNGRNGANGANGFALAWSIDGAAQTGLSGVDNDTRRIDAVRLGAVAGLDVGTSGTLFVDAFDSRRASAPGPTASASTTAITYTYDPLQRLTGANLAGGLVFSYTYDAVGNRLSETTPLSTLSYTYDDANRLTSAGGQAYVHDRNGNLLSDGVYTYTYDTVDRLITQTGAGVSASFSSNGLGDRQRQVVNGVTTNFALDLNRGLTQVLAESGSNTTFLYGLGRIGERSATAWSYHLPDSLGSVRQLASSAGAITLARRFEPYGDVLTSAGSGASAYGYTGEWQQNSLVYLRARYYASGVGRFISRDTWAGEATRPLSLNRWAYVEANPMARIDPTGRCYAQLSWIRDLPGQDVVCGNVDLAVTIWNHPNASEEERAAALTYVTLVSFGYSAAAVGTAGLAIASGQAAINSAGLGVGYVLTRWPIIGTGVSLIGLMGELCLIGDALKGNTDAAGMLYTGWSMTGYSATGEWLGKLSSASARLGASVGIVSGPILFSEPGGEIRSIQALDDQAFDDFVNSAQAYQSSKGRQSLYTYWRDLIADGLDVTDEVFVYVENGRITGAVLVQDLGATEATQLWAALRCTSACLRRHPLTPLPEGAFFKL